MTAVHNIILNNWEEHVNKPAALMCAWFSFDDAVRDYDTSDLTAAKLWFIHYAADYAKQYNLTPGMDDLRVKGKLSELWGQFTSRAVNSPFAELNSLIASIKASQLQENSRQVDGKLVSTWYPITVWRNLESEAPLIAHPAIALLSVAGSEAAVERSFSAQDAVHTKKRNRLSDRSVQNEMFIRFNSDAVKGKRPGGLSRVLGGTCVELTPDFDEHPSTHGSVKALFRAIAIAEVEEAAAAMQEDASEGLRVEPDEVDGKEEVSDSDSDYESDGEQDSESGSSSDESSEEKKTPLNRSASIAKQVMLEAFITKFITDNNLTPESNWKNRELTNNIESASLAANVRTTTADLKKLIKKAVMG
jgi:hypothetical protein